MFQKWVKMVLYFQKLTHSVLQFMILISDLDILNQISFNDSLIMEYELSDRRMEDLIVSDFII